MTVRVEGSHRRAECRPSHGVLRNGHHCLSGSRAPLFRTLRPDSYAWREMQSAIDYQPPKGRLSDSIRITRGGPGCPESERRHLSPSGLLGAARNGAISGGIRRSQGASFGRAHWRGSVRTLHKLLYCCCRSRRSWVMIADTAPADDAPADGLHCKGCMDARCPHCRHEHTQPRQRPGVRCDRNPCQTLSVIHSSLSC